MFRIEVVVQHSEGTGNRFLSAFRVDTQSGHRKRLYFTKANGESKGAIPITNASEYPGYVEWIIERVTSGEMRLPTVSMFRDRR